MKYPLELLPKKNYGLIANESVRGCGFIRETVQNIVEILEQIEKEIVNFSQTDGADSLREFIIRNIVGENNSKTEVFEMSLFLYGIFDERHVGIRVSDKRLTGTEWTKDAEEIDLEQIHCEKHDFFPLYLKADVLDSGIVEFENQNYKMSFEHKPNLVNFWHFQIFANEDNVRLSRNVKKTKYKRLARHILETKVARAICKKEDLIKFSIG